MSDPPVRSSLESLGQYFVGDVTLCEAARKVCHASLDAVEPAVMAGLSVTVDARVGTYASTHPELRSVEQPQYDTGHGPCVDAFRTGVAVIIDSTAEPGPYPEFRCLAAGHGLLSVMSLPLNTRTTTVGALNLYARHADAFTRADVETGCQFAGHAAYLLLNHQAYWDAKSRSENLIRAMNSRAEIEQAKGIIMGATGCTAEEAFEQLRAQSQAENIKLRDIALEIVQRAHRRK